jgi:hypothetical protein
MFCHQGRSKKRVVQAEEDLVVALGGVVASKGGPQADYLQK